MSEAKICTKCQKELPLTEFPKSDRGKWGVNSRCRKCLSHYYAEYQRINAEKRVEQRRQNREKLAEANKRWRTNNPDRVKATFRKWAENHPEDVLANAKRQKFKRSRAFAISRCDLTSEQWTSIKEEFQGRCAYCGIAKTLTQDHIIPVSKGGEHTMSNIVPACRSCNSRKGARSGIDYHPDFESHRPAIMEKIA